MSFFIWMIVYFLNSKINVASAKKSNYFTIPSKSYASFGISGLFTEWHVS